MKVLITGLFLSIAVSGSLFAHAGKETFVLEEVARIHTELFEGKTGTIDTKKLVGLLKEEADRKKIHPLSNRHFLLRKNWVR